jgi:hypothetical protein
MIHIERNPYTHLLQWLTCCFLTIFTTTSKAQEDLSSTKAFRIELSPQVGAGSMTSGERVRHTSGYGLTIGKPWQTSWLARERLQVVPKIEFLSLIINSQGDAGDVKRISTYDHRIIAVGVSLNRQVDHFNRFWDGLFLGFSYGKGFSKLTINESTARTFRQSQFSGISGTHIAAEVGTFLPLKQDFGLSFGLFTNHFQAQQSGAKGTFQGEELGSDDSLSLVSGTNTAEGAGLKAKVGMSSYGAKLGIVFDF